MKAQVVVLLLYVMGSLCFLMGSLLSLVGVMNRGN